MLVIVITHLSFPKMEEKFSELSEFRESEKITQAWIEVNLKILSVASVLMALWYHLCLSCNKLWVRDSDYFTNT